MGPAMPSPCEMRAVLHDQSPVSVNRGFAVSAPYAHIKTGTDYQFPEWEKPSLQAKTPKLVVCPCFNPKLTEGLQNPERTN